MSGWIVDNGQSLCRYLFFGSLLFIGVVLAVQWRL